jgi:hypothetical protein
MTVVHGLPWQAQEFMQPIPSETQDISCEKRVWIMQEVVK